MKNPAQYQGPKPRADVNPDTCLDVPNQRSRCECA